VHPDTLGQAVGTEDVTSSGHEVVAFKHDSCVGLHADWALNARGGGAGGGGRDSGAGGTGSVLDGDWCRGIGRSSQVYGGVQRGPGLWGDWVSSWLSLMISSCCSQRPYSLMDGLDM